MSVYAQQNVFYGKYNEKLLTKRQLDSVITRRKAQYEPRGLGVYVKMDKAVERNDSSFYDYTIFIESKKMIETRRKLDSFIDQKLPAFSLYDLAGKKITNTSLLGKPTVLNMWFTTCGGCIQEMPALNTVMANKLNKDINFISLTYEKKEKVLAFLKKYDFKFRHLPNAKQYCDLFTQEYPITIFVDREGIIRAIQRGLPQIAAGASSKNQVLAADNKNYLDTTELYTSLDLIR